MTAIGFAVIFLSVGFAGGAVGYMIGNIHGYKEARDDQKIPEGG